MRIELKVEIEEVMVDGSGGGGRRVAAAGMVER